MTPAAPTFDILGLGCAAVDELLYVAAYPAADAKQQVLRRERRCGGQTATALVAAARLGVTCAYAGVLGEDEPSQCVLDALRREGIDLSHLVRRAEARPIRATVIVDERLRTRTIFYDLAGAVGADPELPAAEVIRSTRVLFVDQFGVEGMTRAAHVARAAGIPVVADLEGDAAPGFIELLGLADHVILSRDFAEHLTGQADPAGAVGALWTGKRQAAVVTCGADGCWYRGAGQGQPRHQPAFAVRAVDTTGCGDVFHGAYAAALARGEGLAERIRLASAAAALKAARAGGHAALPTRREVETFLRSCDP